MNASAKSFSHPSIFNCLSAASKINQSKRMTSKEIAELTGKRHDNVMRDVKSLIDQDCLHELSFEFMSENISIGNGATRKSPYYSLDFHATMTLITGYNAKLRSAVIARWIELEEELVEPDKASEPANAEPITRTFYYHNETTTFPILVSLDADKNPWFRVHDIFTVLGYANHYSTYHWIKREKDQLKKLTVPNNSGTSELVFMTHALLDNILGSSGKTEKYAFKRWLQREVFPALENNSVPATVEAQRPIPTNIHYAHDNKYLLSFKSNGVPVLLPVISNDFTMTLPTAPEPMVLRVTGYMAIEDINRQMSFFER